MKLTGILGVLCLVAAPVMGGPVTYTFNSTSGSVVLNVEGQGSTSSGMAGTFAITIFQSNGHIGASDTFILEDAALKNTGTMKLGLAGLATATLNANSARFLDFAPAGPSHITGDMVPNPVTTDVYLEVTAFVTGLTTTTFVEKLWAETLLPFTMAISTSGKESDVVTAALSGTFGYAIGVSDISLTITLDLIVNIEGTAHAVPDPALGGLTALGLGGAGAWLRRRRS
jgi:hypothetical protein